MKEFVFDVNFKVTIESESYEQAVRTASKTFPDINGRTVFIVDTDQYGFSPNQSTIEEMHDEKECSCHNPEITNIENIYEE